MYSYCTDKIGDQTVKSNDVCFVVMQIVLGGWWALLPGFPISPGLPERPEGPGQPLTPSLPGSPRSPKEKTSMKYQILICW